ncbi:putative ribonuclease H-like domain-containing protein [Tanacetum coccineum]
MNVSPIPTTRIDKDHPKDQIIRDLNSAIQTRRMTKISDEHAMNVWTLVDLPNGKRAIGIKWVFRNKKDKRGIVVRNKAGLVAQGYTQEEGINYDEVFAPVAKIEAIRLFLAYASYMGFIVYHMDVKSAFLYGTIEEEMIHKRFQMSSMGELTFFLGLEVQQKEDGIFISQDKYVAEILKKFDFATVKITSTLIETNKALVKDEEAEAQCKKRLYVANSSTDADKTVYKEWEDRMERDATTASSLEAEYDSGNINRTQSMATFNEPSP